MPDTIIVLLREDPMTTGRPVEGLRIALGLSTGSKPLLIILLGKSRLLLTDDALDVEDAEILEKHLPVIQELEIPIVVPQGSSEEYTIDPGFSFKEASVQEIQTHLFNAYRVMAIG
jgi:hypothetical protein